ncbi:MAG: two-component sensor histidine kinase [Bacteroidetes bacterium]|nr:two-component sensor histidine kinase [Bacteroidota bacterium]
MTPNRSQNRLVFYLIFAYILASFSWWSLLFLRQNQRAFQEDADALRQAWVAQGGAEALLPQTEAYRQLQAELKRKNTMIAGEGLVFLTLISIGFWRINRSFNREIEISRQQNNFLLSITHELKSPLASIKLAMETLNRRALKPEQVQRIATMSLEDVDRLERMVENILLASRMEDPNHRFEHLDFDLSACTRQVVGSLQRRYPEQSVQLETEPGLRLNGDELALSSVILNLVDNALKYSPSGSPVQVSLQHSGERLLLTVADRGPGVPDAEKAKVFQRFYRIGNEETRSSKGTGLGLFIVQEIVRAHHGQIALKDREGGGSVFEIALPPVEDLPEPVTNTTPELTRS